MSGALDFTHDPAAQSWVASANAQQSDFPLQNLPWARLRRAGEDWRGKDARKGLRDLLKASRKLLPSL